jgi:hypothetical protein
MITRRSFITRAIALIALAPVAPKLIGAGTTEALKSLLSHIKITSHPGFDAVAFWYTTNKDLIDAEDWKILEASSLGALPYFGYGGRNVLQAAYVTSCTPDRMRYTRGVVVFLEAPRDNFALPVTIRISREYCDAVVSRNGPMLV